MFDQENCLKSDVVSDFRKPVRKDSFFNFFTQCNLEDAVTMTGNERR